MFEHLKLSQRFLSLSLFIWILVSSFCSGLMFHFFLLLQLVDLSPGFLPFTVGSLYILLYSTLGILHLFLHFCDQAQSVLWASWLPVFWTLHLIGWLSLCHLVIFFSGALICSFIWAIVLCLDIPVMLAGGRALGIHPGGATLSAALWRCLWGRGQRGNNGACLLSSSPTFQRTLSCETGNFSRHGNPCSSSQLAWVFHFPCSQAHLAWGSLLPHPESSPPTLLPVSVPPTSLVDVSTPWWPEFHAVRFSGTSGFYCF